MTAEDKIKAQDDMIRILGKAGLGELMDQPNAEGKTPRELREKRRNGWRETDEVMRAIKNGTWRGRGGRGRGRGRGRGG